MLIKPLFILILSSLISHYVIAEMNMTKQGSRHETKRTIGVNTPIPQLSAALFKDEFSGYNLHLALNNYQLQPPELSKGNQNKLINLEGHAHLYINGVKIGRLYGRYYHLAESAFSPGVNNIKITLNDHQHATWMFDNKAIMSSLMINTNKDRFLLYQFETQGVN